MQMTHIRNGMLATELPDVAWRKSSRSHGNSNCVALAPLAGGVVGMLDTKHPTGHVLVFTPDDIGAWTADIKAGALDHLI
ncbi:MULTISPECIES: DUF397 domain-containing protein [Streptosporangium]|uniref:DUF397 domain-containing protein n=1 Tax=Streptosporangium brasiliense TaxID=47480 RepID=A0ABT9RM74_9ACTN|nr:DUF397 domain-containing protein [Streptosporangium brasiliense]MDP9870360.1 hypothetical protein [Streptosporangium brasiliense]